MFACCSFVTFVTTDSLFFSLLLFLILPSRGTRNKNQRSVLLYIKDSSVARKKKTRRRREEEEVEKKKSRRRTEKEVNGLNSSKYRVLLIVYYHSLC